MNGVIRSKVVLLFVLSAFCTPKATEAEVRTWTATAGFKIDAEFVTLKTSDVVQLRTVDGRTIDVELSQLVTADQDYVRKRQASVSLVLGKAQRSADRCRKPEDAIVVYKVFIEDPQTSAGDKAIAEQRIAELKQLMAENKVRLNKKWVSDEEAKAVRARADAILRQGLALWKIKQFDEGRKRFMEASLLEPESIRAEFLLALLYAFEREPDKAILVFQKCLTRDPENVAVLNNLAMLGAAQADWQTMSANWRKALAVQPDQRVVHNIGRFLAQSDASNTFIPKAPRDALAGPYAELVGSGKFEATDPEVGWLFLLIDESDLEIMSSARSGESQTRSVKPDTTAEGPVVGGGTGFVVAPGYVITNAHVAEDDCTFEIQAADGTLHKAERIAKADGDVDLALLKCEAITAPALPLATEVAPRGTDVMLLGYPEMFSLGATLKATRGSISSVPDPRVKNMYLYDAVTNSGNSGGPVCDNCGNIVAVHAAGINTASRYGGGVPSQAALEFLKAKIPEVRLESPHTTKLDWPDVDRGVSPSTVLIWVRNVTGRSSERSAGSDFIELPICMFCGGAKITRCNQVGCRQGYITQRGLKSPCPKCNGKNYFTCGVCEGLGIDMQLASVRRRLEQIAADNEPRSETPKPAATPVTPPPATSTSPPTNAFGGPPQPGSMPPPQSPDPQSPDPLTTALGGPRRPTPSTPVASTGPSINAPGGTTPSTPTNTAMSTGTSTNAFGGTTRTAPPTSVASTSTSTNAFGSTTRTGTPAAVGSTRPSTSPYGGKALPATSTMKPSSSPPPPTTQSSPFGSSPRFTLGIRTVMVGSKPVKIYLDQLSIGIQEYLEYDPGMSTRHNVRFAGNDPVAPMLRTLESKNEYGIRSLVVRLFDAIPDPGYMPQLAEALEKRAVEDPNWVIRTDSVRALATWNRPESFALLHQLMRDKSWPVRRQAAFAVVHAGDDSGVPFLVESLRKPDVPEADAEMNPEYERELWKKCLIVYGPTARSQIEAIKDDADPAVRKAASEILAAYDEMLN